MARTSSAAATADRHPVDQMLPAGQLLLYGLQHVMSMYAGVVAVPLIVGLGEALEIAGREGRREGERLKTLGFSLKDVAAMLEAEPYFRASFTEDEVRAAQAQLPAVPKR